LILSGAEVQFDITIPELIKSWFLI